MMRRRLLGSKYLEEYKNFINGVIVFSDGILKGGSQDEEGNYIYDEQSYLYTFYYKDLKLKTGDYNFNWTNSTKYSVNYDIWDDKIYFLITNYKSTINSKMIIVDKYGNKISEKQFDFRSYEFLIIKGKIFLLFAPTSSRYPNDIGILDSNYNVIKTLSLANYYDSSGERFFFNSNPSIAINNNIFLCIKQNIFLRDSNNYTTHGTKKVIILDDNLNICSSILYNPFETKSNGGEPFCLQNFNSSGYIFLPYNAYFISLPEKLNCILYYNVNKLELKTLRDFLMLNSDLSLGNIIYGFIIIFRNDEYTYLWGNLTSFKNNDTSKADIMWDKYLLFRLDFTKRGFGGWELIYDLDLDNFKYNILPLFAKGKYLVGYSSLKNLIIPDIINDPYNIVEFDNTHGTVRGAKLMSTNNYAIKDYSSEIIGLTKDKGDYVELSISDDDTYALYIYSEAFPLTFVWNTTGNTLIYTPVASNKIPKTPISETSGQFNLTFGKWITIAKGQGTVRFNKSSNRDVYFLVKPIKFLAPIITASALFLIDVGAPPLWQTLTINDNIIKFTGVNKDGKHVGGMFQRIRLKTDLDLQYTFNIKATYSAETNYDYVSVGKIDLTYSGDYNSVRNSSYYLFKINSSQNYSITIPSGEHFVDFCFTKDGSVDSGDDSVILEFTDIEDYTTLLDPSPIL